MSQIGQPIQSRIEHGKKHRIKVDTSNMEMSERTVGKRTQLLTQSILQGGLDRVLLKVGKLIELVG